MLRLALIGCGAHGEAAHADPLARYQAQHPGDMALVGACDITLERAERLCRKYGFDRAYDDSDAMLAGAQPDAVVCAVPIAQIAPIGSALLRRRIPCVLEKPLGASPQEVAVLAQVARETGTPHQVSVNRRFSPYLNRALGWARQIGPLRYVRGRMVRHRRREDGFLWGTGVHVVDALRYIGGEWAHFDVQVIAPPAVSAPWFLISLEFASGCRGAIEVLPTTGVAEEGYELFGESFHASVSTMGWAGEWVRCWRDGKQEVEMAANPNDPLCLRDGSFEEASAFVRGLQEGIPLRPTVEDVAPSLELCRQIVAKGGR